MFGNSHESLWTKRKMIIIHYYQCDFKELAGYRAEDIQQIKKVNIHMI